MTFVWPWMLTLLALLPLAAALYTALQRRNEQMAEKLRLFGALPGAPTPLRAPGRRRHVPAVLFLAGLAALLFAMARPQAVVSLPRLEGTVILAFDISGSMAAEDLQPNRLEAAKEAARGFIARMPSTVEVGVVAFSDSGFTIQSPTSEAEASLATIDRLQPQTGTSLGEGIVASLQAIAAVIPPTGLPAPDEGTPGASGLLIPEEMHGKAVIVLLSDGENNMFPDPLEAAKLAADNGVRIDTVGIGSPGGTTVSIDGFQVHTRLEEAMLQSIAQISGGAYYNAQNENELQQIYDNISPHLVVRPESIEITALLVGASLIAMLVGGLFSLLWFNRLP